MVLPSASSTGDESAAAPRARTKWCGVRAGRLRRAALPVAPAWCRPAHRALAIGRRRRRAHHVLPAAPAPAWCWSAHRGPAICWRQRHARVRTRCCGVHASRPQAGPVARDASMVLVIVSSTSDRPAPAPRERLQFNALKAIKYLFSAWRAQLSLLHTCPLNRFLLTQICTMAEG